VEKSILFCALARLSVVVYVEKSILFCALARLSVVVAYIPNSFLFCASILCFLFSPNGV